jgi:ATP dependent DNA ligase-like protein/integrase-like protein
MGKAPKTTKTPPGARKAKLPDFIAPQLATLVKEPPLGDNWLHELKFDGYRMLCRIDRGTVQFWSRNARDWTAKFPVIVEAVKVLPTTTAFLDGEIVVVDAQGRSSFQKLQRSMGKCVPTGFVYAVFDLMYLDGFDLRKTRLTLRKDLLEKLVKGAGRGLLCYSEHLEGNGDAFFRHACEYGIEGIVSKLADSPYESTQPTMVKGEVQDIKKSFSAACREAGITNFTFHDLRHTFGIRLADAGVDVVKIKELMGHASIVTTMRYIHATDQGKRGAITVLSEYRQQRSRKDGHKLVTIEKRQAQ